MRGGSADNVYVIPAPSVLPFGAATLLATACCLHALLWLISMWDKILEINWRNFRNRQTDEEQAELANEQISGTNGATNKRMGMVNDMIKVVLGLVVIPIFFGAGLAILIIGEFNFYSQQVRYETEPMASIGKSFHVRIRIGIQSLTITRSMGLDCWNGSRCFRFTFRFIRAGC